MSGPQKAILTTVRRWNRSMFGHHACEGSSLVERLRKETLLGPKLLIVAGVLEAVLDSARMVRL
jgi:hypothetical protein